MDLVENDVDTLHEEIKYLVGHLVENDVDTLHEEIIHLVGFSFIRVIDTYHNHINFISSNTSRFTENKYNNSLSHSSMYSTSGLHCHTPTRSA